MYRFRNHIHIIAGCDGARGIRRRRGIASLLLFAAVSSPAFAIDAPPLSPDQVTPAILPSSISATIQIGMAALDRAVERRVPRRIASFNDKVTQCWHRRILGREVDVDCVYSGYVERVGGVPLRAEGGRLTAATPLFGTVSAQGTGRFTSRLHGTAEGQLTVFASARPRLRPDWSVSLDISEGFRWTEPPTLTILGFRINLERYVEPRISGSAGTAEGRLRSQAEDPRHSRQGRARLAAGVCDRADHGHAGDLAADNAAVDGFLRNPRATRHARGLDRHDRDRGNRHRHRAAAAITHTAAAVRQRCRRARASSP